MRQPVPWFERRFSFDIPDGLYPSILERLRGTPARLEDRLRALPREILVRGKPGSWSIQENAGHLYDLEPLWAARVQDFIQGREKLQAADLTNRKTSEAGHNRVPLEKILASFRAARSEIIAVLEDLDPVSFSKTALHPRLNAPMRLIDHLFFVAEHDDHHLASISWLARSFT